MQTPRTVSARWGFHAGLQRPASGAPRRRTGGRFSGSGSGSGSGGGCGGSGSGFPSSTCVLCSVTDLSSPMRVRGRGRIPCRLAFRGRRARPDYHGAITVSQPRGGACTLRPGAWTDPPNQFGVPILTAIVHETSPADMTTKSPITAPIATVPLSHGPDTTCEECSEQRAAPPRVARDGPHGLRPHPSRHRKGALAWAVDLVTERLAGKTRRQPCPDISDPRPSTPSRGLRSG